MVALIRETSSKEVDPTSMELVPDLYTYAIHLQFSGVLVLVFQLCWHKHLPTSHQDYHSSQDFFNFSFFTFFNGGSRLALVSRSSRSSKVGSLGAESSNPGPTLTSLAHQLTSTDLWWCHDEHWIYLPHPRMEDFWIMDP